MVTIGRPAQGPLLFALLSHRSSLRNEQRHGGMTPAVVVTVRVEASGAHPLAPAAHGEILDPNRALQRPGDGEPPDVHQKQTMDKY